MKSFLKTAEEYARGESERTNLPTIFNLDLSLEKALWLAEKLNADQDIVRAGALLMDCQLGIAISENRIQDHVSMSAKKAQELMQAFPELSEDTKSNILSCIRQHHGAKSFDTLEAEICCNADCYRFASIQGFLGGIRNTRDMPMDDLLKLLSEKADEKWNALSIDLCKHELESEYELIREMLDEY